MSNNIEQPSDLQQARKDGGVLHRMPQLDGLRAIAISLVVWSHWCPKYKLQTGTLGVRLFFVLSGFLISGILLDCRSRGEGGRQKWFILRRFYVRRFLRIFPLYYGIIALACSLDIRPFRQSWPWHVAYLSNWHYWQIGNLDGYGTQIWSLSVEEQFYLLWPGLLLFVPKKALRYSVLVLVFTAPLFRYAAFLRLVKTPEMAYFLTPSALDALGLGSLLAYAERFELDSVPRLTKLLLGIGVIGCAAILWTHGMGWWEFTTWDCGFVWLIWRASRGFQGWFGKLLEFKPVIYLGKISYGIYVIHGFSLALWYWLLYSAPVPGYRILARIHIGADVYNKEGFVLLMMGLITVTLSVLSFHFYETPINNLKRLFPYLASNRSQVEERKSLSN